MTELWQLSATESAEKIASKDIKPSELMASVADRIEQVNPRLNAITVDMREQALVEAQQADEAIADGRGLGSLFGVPVTIKENIDIAGMATTNGLPILADNIATEDSPLVGRLKEAGAIIIGRTNTPEFSMRATTDNPLRGRTVNPWGEEISPGGSSGGAGSAAASGMGPLHHGNDIGGSLRFPSSANGVTSVKPTTCRVPVFNSTNPAERGPLAQAMSVQGVIGRHVADIRTATQILVQPDPRDPMSPPVPWEGPPVGKDGRVTVALTKETNGYTMHPAINELIDIAAAHLVDAGYEVVEVDPPPVAEAAEGWFSAFSTEMRSTMDGPLRQFGSETVNQIFDWYYELSTFLDLDGYIGAVAHRTGLMRQWKLFLQEHPLVLTPFLMRPMYDWNYDASSLAAVADLFDSAIYSTGINYLGLPSGVICPGLADGRPAAVQLVADYYREDVICDALQAIEDRTGILAHQLWAQ